MINCGDALIKILEGYGVNTIFGIPGLHTIDLYRSLSKTRIRHITPRHEQGAGFMADGYARATGEPGVCLVITGPGMTNMATAMAQALADSIPMLVISSVNATHQLGMGEGHLHDMPSQRKLVAGVSVFSHTLLRVDELPKLLARAFSVFSCRRPGPVHIEIPLDIIIAPAAHLDRKPFSLPSAPAAAPAAISAAVELLTKAQRPLIVVGGGAVRAAKEVVTVAERIAAPVVNTVNAKGLIPYSHPLAAGGSGSHQVIREEFLLADVILAIGTEFGETDYDFFFAGDIQIRGQVIRIDIDAEQLSRNLKADLAICSDACLALQALATDLQDFEADMTAGAARAVAMRQALHAQRDTKYEGFFSAIREALPEVIIAGDSTQPTYYAWLHYETEQVRSYFHSASGFGTLGYAIPAAIGAKLGRPDRPVIGLIGDGGAQFTIGELASAVEAAIPVIFLIWNNSGYGEIKRSMETSAIPLVGVDIVTPDFTALGRAFGCEVRQVTSISALKAELLVASERKLPTLIEVKQQDFADGYPVP